MSRNPLTPAIEETQTLAHARRVIRQKKDQVWLKELGMKKKTHAAGVGRDPRDFTHFHALIQDRTGRDYLVLQIKGHLPPKKSWEQ